MPPVGAQCQALEPLWTPNGAVAPFVGDFRLQSRISNLALLNLNVSLTGERVVDRREALQGCGGYLQKRRRVKCLCVTATKGQRSDPFGIKRLPTDRNLWSLRVEL